MKCLAIDIGAESGRGIEGWIQDGNLEVRETARFPNKTLSFDDSLRWDIDSLATNVFECVAASSAGLTSVGVDTWAVDFVLLDYLGRLIEPPFHYRDGRTDGMMEEAFKVQPRRSIYETTGIQFMPINTLFQLFSMSRSMSPALQHACTFLTIPDYLSHLLLGGGPRRLTCEFTNATTTQCVSYKTGKWAGHLLRKLGIPTNIFPDIVKPGTVLGSMASGTKVIAPASHDTGSAVAAVPSEANDFAWISSGTWSIMGAEVPAPVVSDESYEHNFTNEGGVGGTCRLSKNVMGLWLLQQCRSGWAESGREFSYEELASMAAASEGVVFDPDDPELLSPGDMPSRILSRVGGSSHDPGFIVRSILESLADKYRIVLSQLETLVGRRLERLHIIGGGSQNRLLNQLTANACGRSVVAGPAEATAIGNLMVQMIALGEIPSVAEGRGDD